MAQKAAMAVKDFSEEVYAKIISIRAGFSVLVKSIKTRGTSVVIVV